MEQIIKLTGRIAEVMPVVEGISERTGNPWKSQVRHRHHAPHDFDLLHRKAVVEASAVAHHGIDEDFRAFGGLLAAIVADELRLRLGIHIACANGVAAESELLPDGQRSANIVGSVEYVEKAVVKGV